MNDLPGEGAPDLTVSALTARTLDDFLRTLASAAVARIRSCDGCGVTLQRAGLTLTVASAGADAPALDEKQYRQDDGPCLQSMRTGREVTVRDTLTEHRWGAYPAFAASRGTRSSLSLPLTPGPLTQGALNLYASIPDGFRTADLVVLRALAAEATGAVALAERMARARELSVQMPASLRQRSVVDRAIGVLMAQRNCRSAQARALLAEQASSRNIPLVEVCGEVVAGFEESAG